MRFAQMLRSQNEINKTAGKIAEEVQEHILVVKEDQNDADIFKRNLENLGYTVKHVHNGYQALTAIKSNKPNLVISDVMLEGMKGHELFRIIRSDPESSSIPFMFISSPESTPDKMLGFQGYGDDYINTPFDFGVLKSRVEALIRRKKKSPEPVISAEEMPLTKIEAEPPTTSVVEAVREITHEEPAQDVKALESPVVTSVKFIPDDDFSDEPVEENIAASEGSPHTAEAKAVVEELDESCEEEDAELAEDEDTEEIEDDKDKYAHEDMGYIGTAFQKMTTEAKFKAQPRDDKKLPTRKELMHANPNNLYLFGRDIINYIAAKGGKFNTDDYLFISSYCEKITEASIANNALVTLALAKNDDYGLGYNSVNKAIVSLRIGNNMNMQSGELALLGTAGLLLDIGMLKVDSDILNKRGKLSRKERAEVNKHIEYGIEIVEDAIKRDFPRECEYISTTILQHHEREEGQGYPNNLNGEQISRPTKILGLADTYEALCHTRYHRMRQTTYHALQEVVSMKKTFFDPRVLRALVNELTFFPIGCYVRLNTDEVGVVIDTSPMHSMRPKIKILLDSEGVNLEHDKVVDLVESPFLYVVKPLDDDDVPEFERI